MKLSVTNPVRQLKLPSGRKLSFAIPRDQDLIDFEGFVKDHYRDELRLTLKSCEDDINDDERKALICHSYDVRARISFFGIECMNALNSSEGFVRFFYLLLRHHHSDMTEDDVRVLTADPGLAIAMKDAVDDMIKEWLDDGDVSGNGAPPKRGRRKKNPIPTRRAGTARQSTGH